MFSIIRGLLFGAFLIATACSIACGHDEPTTSPTPTAAARSTETYGGTIGRGGSQFYSFTVLASGATDVTLLSLRPPGVATTTYNFQVGLGLGVPAGTDCALSTTTNAAPALTAQLTATTNPNTYCVKIADLGNLTANVDYTIRILHP